MHTSDDLDEFGNPSQGEHYQQNFDAPFFPSVNLEGAPRPSNGWAVVTPLAHAQNSTKIEKRNDMISPSLMNAGHISNQDRSNTENHQMEEGEKVEIEAQPLFNLDSFQPELQSGFKPIYPSDDKQETIAPKSSMPKKDDSIEALIYEDTETESVEENETERNEMTTDS